MSQQVFDAEFREAIWSCWSRCCFYCKRPISLEAMQVDHVLPESLLADAHRHAQTLADFGLPASFEILSRRNLAPSCGDCNKRKGELLFEVGQTAIFLAQIKRSLPRLETAYYKAKSERRLSDIMRAVTVGLKQQAFTKAEIQERLNKAISIEHMSGVAESGKQRIRLEWLQMATAPNTALKHSNHTQEGLHIDSDLVRDIEVAIAQGDAFVKRTITILDDRYEVTTSSGIRIVFQVKANVVTIITAFRTRG